MEIQRKHPHLLIMVVFAVIVCMPSGDAIAQYRANGYYPPGEAGRLQYLIDRRYNRSPYDGNVYRDSRHYDPLRNPFRSSRHYQKKVAGSGDSYVLRVFHHDQGHHGRHHGRRHHDHYPYAGVYGSRARLISPYDRSNQVYVPYEHECPPPIIIQQTVPVPEPEPRLDPRDIEYKVIHFVEPEPSQRPVIQKVELPDGRTKTVIRSVPIEKATDEAGTGDTDETSAVVAGTDA